MARADVGAPVTWDSDRNRMPEVDAAGHMWERRRRYAERIDLELDVQDAAGPITGVQAVALPHFDEVAPPEDDDDSADDDDDSADDDDDDDSDDDDGPDGQGCSCNAAPGAGPGALLALLGSIALLALRRRP